MTLYIGSEPVSAYISGTENGRTAYVHIKYSNDGQHILQNPTASQRENAYYIGIRADYSATASETFNDYGWTRVRHDSQFLHLRFAPAFAGARPTNAQMTTDPDADTQFIGLYVDSSATDSTDSSVYHWTRIAYDQCYMHIKYAPNYTTTYPADGVIVDTPNSNTYFIGVCWDRNSTAPTTASSYKWMRTRDSITISYSNDGSNPISNPTAAQIESAYYMGIKINDGSYTWSRVRQDVNSVYVKYATKSGSTYTELTGAANIKDAPYIGICQSTATTAPSDLSLYHWTQIDQTHIRYGNMTSGAMAFVNTPATATHVGFRIDDQQSASNTVADYDWVQIRQPLTYLHVAYAPSNNPTTNQILSAPQSNSTHMAVIVTESEGFSADPNLYTGKWMEIIPNAATYATQSYVQNYHDSTKLNVSAAPTKLSDLTNDVGFVTTGGAVYCTCSTPAATAAKEATIVSGSLTSLSTGAQAIVVFTNSNTVASPTLKIGTTTAKSIKRYGTTAPSTSAASSWNAGEAVSFVYDGSYWQMCDYNNTTYSGMSVAEYQGGTATTARLITPANLKAAIEYHAPAPTAEVIPTASTIAKFDSNAKMNSTDMTSSEVTSFVNSLALGSNSGTLESYIENLVATYVNSKARAFQSYTGTATVASAGSFSFNVSVTTHGGPVLVIATACWNGTENGAWSSMYVSRGSTVLKQTTMVSTTASHNCPGAIVYLDQIGAGTYTYTCTCTSGSGAGTFAENNGSRSESPALCVVEL